MDLPELNTVKPYLFMASEIEPVNLMFAYYIKTFAVQKAHAIYKQMNPNSNQYKALGQQLGQWISELTQVKQQNAQLFSDKDQNKEDLSDFVIKLFFDTDTRERDGEISRELVRNFQVCSRYFEVLAYFGPLSPEIDEKKRYAKMKAIELTKKLKNPELFQKQQQKQEDDFDQQMKDIEKKVQQQSENQSVPAEGQVANFQASIHPNQHIQISQAAPQQQQFQATQPLISKSQYPQTQVSNPYNPKQSVFDKLPQFIPKTTPSQFPLQSQQQSKDQQPLTQLGIQQQPFQQPIQPNNFAQQPSVQQPYLNQAQYNYPSQAINPNIQTQQQQPVRQQQKDQQFQQKQPIQEQKPQSMSQYPPQPQSNITHQQSGPRLTPLQVAEKRAQAKKFLEHAISELDFKKYPQARVNLEQALQIVQELEKQ